MFLSKNKVIRPNLAECHRFSTSFQGAVLECAALECAALECAVLECTVLECTLFEALPRELGSVAIAGIALPQADAARHWVPRQSLVASGWRLVKSVATSAIIAFLFTAHFGTSSYAQTINLIGQFESKSDVGSPSNAGESTYDSENQEYRVTGSGKNMWFDKDEFHFVWKRIKGDFILSTNANLVGEGVDPHRKLGWMVRSTLDTNSAHINAAVHGDGLTSLQFRRTPGADTEELKSSLTGADVIQLERKGNRYTMSVARFGEPFVTTSLDDHKLGGEVYVGLFVCSHNPDVVEEAKFKNVRITLPTPENFVPYRDFIGSRLEILDVETSKRSVLLETPDRIEAPNWTPDGTTLIYNSGGKLYRFPLDTRQPVLIDTGFADKNNNDHVLSFDGKTIGISHHTKEEGGASVVYTLPVTGGVPKRVTSKSPSYLHGWSPDGQSLIYTGERDGKFDIYKIAAAGGEETRLTTAEGLDDGSEYSPDGKFIYFNSSRTGKMKLWRMNSDGTDQMQLTHDDLNDWFPHISPDGKQVAFLSFSKEVAADAHPFYEHVYLRMMPIGGGEPRIIAYVYGGQGTINVPSWSPDGRFIAFVSNTATQ
jgi:TolB protein